MTGLYLAYDAERQPDTDLGLTPAELHAVRLVLSHLVGRMSSWRSSTYNVCRVLASLGGLDLDVDADGVTNERAWPVGKQVMKRNSLSPEKVNRHWQTVRRRKEPLPDDLLSVFVPEELWPVLARFVADGPGQVVEESEPIFYDWAAGFLSNGEPRPRGPLSSSGLGVYISALWTLMSRICEAREWSPDDGTFHEDWRIHMLPKRPAAEDFDAQEAGWDRSAPPLLAVRRALRAIDTEVARKRKLAKTRPHMFQELRERAMLGVLVVHGMRSEALWALDVDHYNPAHHFPDGTVGPALTVPRTKREKVEHTKALPTKVASWLDEYIDYIEAKPGEPLWRPGLKRTRHERLDQQNIDDMLRRLLAPYCGGRHFSPHTLRHFVAGVATLVGIEWIRERSDQFILGARGIPASPQTFADVVLGHALHHIADRYRDMNSKPNREVWTKVAVLGIWEWVWGDLGARKGPDLKLIAEAEDRVRGAKVDLDGLEAKLSELERMARRPKALSESEGIQLVLRMMALTRDLQKATVRHERALRQLDEARTAEVPIDDSLANVPELPESEFALLGYEDEEERPLVRTLLRADEFRWAIGTDILAESTLRAWMGGHRSAFPAGDRRNLFDPPRPGQKYPDAVEVISQHKRYIRVDKLDPSRFHADAWERLMELCRKPEPRMPSRRKSRREQIID